MKYVCPMCKFVFYVFIKREKVPCPKCGIEMVLYAKDE